MIKDALVKDTILYGGSDFILKVIAFAVFPIYTHLFSVAEYGIIGLIGTIAGLVGLFLNLGLNSAAQRFYFDPETPETDRPALISTGLWIISAWSILFSALLCVGLLFFRDYLNTNYGIPLIFLVLALLTNIPTQIGQYCLDAIRLQFAPAKFFVVSFLQNIAGIIFQLLLIVIFGLGLLGYYLGSLIAIVIAMPVGLWAIKKDLSPSFDPAYAKTLVSYGYPFIFAGIGYWVFGSIDRIMLAGFTDLTQVGLYSISFTICVVLTFVNTAFGNAWSPFVIKLYKEEANYREIVSQVLSVWFFCLAVLGIGLILFAKELLILTTPASYWPAASVLSILAIGLVLSGTTQITGLGISLEKKTHLFTWATWTTAVLNICLNYFFIPRWGALGAAMATTASYTCLTAMYLYWSQRLHPIPLEVSRLAMTVACITIISVFAVFVNMLDLTRWVEIAKIIAFGLIIFTGFRLGLIPKDLPEIVKTFIFEIIRRKKKEESP